MAMAELDGWYRVRLGDSAAVVRIRRGLVPVSGDRLSRRRSAFRCSGNMDVRPQHRMGLFKTPAADGMGRARMDVGVSAHQLVVSVDGARQCRSGAVGTE